QAPPVDRIGLVREARAFRELLSALVLAGEQATPDRAPRDDREAVGLRHRQQLALDAAVEQVVWRLLADEAVEAKLLRHPQRLDELPRRVRAAADVAHLAGADQIVERAQRLVDRDVGLRSVDLV